MSDYLDRFGRGQSMCHRWPPLIKLCAAIAMILAATCVPIAHGPLIGIVACVIFIAHTLARIPLAYVARRLLFFWPPLFLMAISLPLSQSGQTGWLLFLTIVVRGTLSFSTALWLVNVMPFDQLLATLRRLRVPDVLLAILSLMYRFLFVLWDELDRMRTARAARLFRKPSLWATWRSAAHLLGRLLIRALDRADRIHGAMLARGWDGRSRWIDPLTAQACFVSGTALAAGNSPVNVDPKSPVASAIPLKVSAGGLTPPARQNSLRAEERS